MNLTRKLSRDLQTKIKQGIDEEQIYFLFRYHLRDAVKDVKELCEKSETEAQVEDGMNELKQKWGIPK